MEKIAQEILAIRQRLVGTPIKMKAVTGLLRECLTALFPHWHEQLGQTHESLKADLIDINKYLAGLISTLGVDSTKANTISDGFIKALPRILTTLEVDAKALLAGDPAAQSLDEVVITYPGFYALAIHRLAHELYANKVPLIPRIWAEYAHSKTGIDIHPGASIAEGFCIDHGTGVVIGETSIIKENVKIYQGVTLGGLSIAKNLAGKKRHPTIEQNVVIYAGATILGGETVVGKGSTIGGNVWITESVAPNSKVYGNSK